MLLSRGGSHRSAQDGELVRWGADFARVEGTVAPSVADLDGRAATTVEVVIARTGPGARKHVMPRSTARS